jgi:presenilin-like A22 family membrane protease
MPQTAVFFTMLAVVVTTMVGFGLVLYGMRGEPGGDQRGLPKVGTGTGIRTPVPWLRTTCPDP